MKKKIYGYIRVSTIAQHDDRQRLAMEEFGVEEQFLFADKQSGKDFDRPAYQALLGKIGAGDTLVVNIKTRYLIQSYRHGTLGRRLWHQRYLYLPCLHRFLKSSKTLPYCKFRHIDMKILLPTTKRGISVCRGELLSERGVCFLPGGKMMHDIWNPWHGCVRIGE